MKTTIRRNDVTQQKRVRKSPPGEVERGCSMERRRFMETGHSIAD